MTRDCAEHGENFSMVSIEDMLNPSDEEDFTEHLPDVAQREYIATVNYCTITVKDEDTKEEGCNVKGRSALGTSIFTTDRYGKMSSSLRKGFREVKERSGCRSKQYVAKH